MGIAFLQRRPWYRASTTLPPSPDKPDGRSETRDPRGHGLPPDQPHPPPPLYLSTCLYTAATKGFSKRMARLFLSRSRIVNTPPGRRIRYASRNIARDTHSGDSWFTRHIVARSNLFAGSPVSSAGACRRETFNGQIHDSTEGWTTVNQVTTGVVFCFVFLNRYVWALGSASMPARSHRRENNQGF